jgi:hypothetical protein
MNRILINYTMESGETIPLEYPIYEDFQIEANTEFSSFAELAPTIDSLVNLGNMVSSTGGGVGPAGLGLRSILDAPRWQKTNPVKITIDMFFYTKEDPVKDVLFPINTLLGAHVLKKSSDGKRVLVPGINAGNSKEIDKIIKNIGKEEKAAFIDEAGGEDKLKKFLSGQYNSIFSVIIPGVVYLPAAFIFAIQPTYSKQVTAKGYPLWAQANVQIQSITPALYDNFTQGQNFYYSRLLGSVQNSNTGFGDLFRGF